MIEKKQRKTEEKRSKIKIKYRARELSLVFAYGRR